jgi:hypothetical protein
MPVTRNLSFVAHQINLAMARRVPVTLTLMRGDAMTFTPVAKRLRGDYKYDPRVKDRSPLTYVGEDGQEIALEDVAAATIR